MSDPTGVDMMFALVLEDGKRWGDIAADFQVEDAEAIFAKHGPRLHFLTRGRGGSKTTDVAGIALSWLAMEAPPRARGYIVAATADQAAEVIDAAASLIWRTPELEGVIVAEAERLVGPEEAWVRVLSSSDAGAWGKRDTHFFICDEFAQWPETRGAKRVYEAVRSSIQKTPGCRLIILTSAGEPSHWSYDMLQRAQRDPEGWRVHEVPGPVPWQDPKEIKRLERELSPSSFSRLVLNRWTQSEDRLVSIDDLEAATVLSGQLPPQPDRSYVIGLDLGLKIDPTVLAVCHGEPVNAEDGSLIAMRVVLDKMVVWQGSAKRPVDTTEVERAVLHESRVYNGAHVVADPWNTAEMGDRLRIKGVMFTQYKFSTESVARLAFVLHNQFRNRLIHLPDDPDLCEELANVELKGTNIPGHWRMDHKAGQHDDRAVALALATEAIVARPEWNLEDIYAPASETEADLADPWAGIYGPPKEAEDPFAVLHVHSEPSNRSWRIAGKLEEVA